MGAEPAAWSASWKKGRSAALAASRAPPQVRLPVGFTTFLGEIFRAPRGRVQKATPISPASERSAERPPAAWDEPEVFATAIRGAFQGAAL